MEQLKLTHQEQAFYGECFQSCDADGNGRISSSRASDLFMYSGLGPEVLLQVRLTGSAVNSASLNSSGVLKRNCDCKHAFRNLFINNLQERSAMLFNYM